MEQEEKDYFTIRVDVKFNKKTLSILDKKCADLKLNRSKYIRQLIEEDNKVNGLFSKDERTELNRIGNNLNQNTTFANSNKILSSKLESTLDTLDEFMERFS